MKKLFLSIAIALSASLCSYGQGDKRPPVAERCFTSQAVESLMQKVASTIKDEKLREMFLNCYPNTLDTTVKLGTRNGHEDTFVITGDINAMWLRDSSAQLFPYLSLLKEDPALARLVAGAIRRQVACILIDPYANAFNREATGSEWETDYTKMLPELHERKWEIDSLCYAIRLAYYYWLITGDTSVFDNDWQWAMHLVVQTFREQQRKENRGPYNFQRKSHTPSDTQQGWGWGAPVNPVGLIFSAFRPSDDATQYGFLIPSNMFAVVSLNQLAEMSEKIQKDSAFASECREMAKEVDRAIKQYAIVTHPKYGKIYAYEVDGFGNYFMMDDANVPSLLSAPYLGYCKADDPVYQNTRRFVWSESNPYFFRGKDGEGIGGPHVGVGYAWPMSMIMKGLTIETPKAPYNSPKGGGLVDTETSGEGQALKDTSNTPPWGETEGVGVRDCLYQLTHTDGDTGFMHESFNVNDHHDFTRKWFAWANNLFGELVIKTYNEHPEILSSVLSSESVTLNYATFNIRYANKDDQKKGRGWNVRRDTLSNYVLSQNLDIIGMQEVLHSQLLDLQSRLKDYAFVGVGRDDGKTKGEYAPIFYKKDKFTLLDSGTFWLSQYPDSVGFIGWDGACCRIATWAKFRDKATGRTFLSINTHFDHVGTEARRNGALLIIRKIRELVGDAPAVLTGDFNVDDQSEAYRTITTNDFVLRDAHLVAERTQGNLGTYTDFGRIPASERSKIDFVFVTKNVQVFRSYIPDLMIEGVAHPFMSDHQPVITTLRF